MDIDAKDTSDAPAEPQTKEFALSYHEVEGSTSWALGEDTGSDEVTVILSGVVEGSNVPAAKLSAVLTAIEHIGARDDYDTLPSITMYVFSGSARLTLFELGSMFGKIYVAPRSAMTREADWSRPCITACRLLLGLNAAPPETMGPGNRPKPRAGRERGPVINIATDGSVCGGRGGGGSYGWVCEDGTYGMGPVDTTDILVAEIKAVTAALYHANPYRNIRILTDSKPAITHIERSAIDISGVGNTRNVTKALRKLHERMEKHASVEIVWVRAHNGNPLNDGADRLARMARQTKDGVSLSAQAEIAQNIVDDVISELNRTGE